MPSSHSAIVCSLAVLIGRQYGFDSGIFAIAFVFAFIVMYDAAGVRRAAGKQAQILNKILYFQKKCKLRKYLRITMSWTFIKVSWTFFLKNDHAFKKHHEFKKCSQIEKYHNLENVHDFENSPGFPKMIPD